LSPAYRPVEPAALPGLVASRIDERTGIVRVAVDGPPCAHPHEFAAALAEPLRLLGRPFEQVRAETFWRDASLRLEYGREDVDSFPSWLDAAALRREVLDPVLGARAFLPSLRDPATNRATREPRRPVAAATVVAVSGSLLLGRGLPFDVTVHLAVSPDARARRTPADDAWTLPAFDLYDGEVRPNERADIVIRWDDVRHPAVWTADA
jgi:hypothetical protein